MTSSLISEKDSMPFSRQSEFNFESIQPKESDCPLCPTVRLSFVQWTELTQFQVNWTRERFMNDTSVSLTAHRPDLQTVSFTNAKSKKEVRKESRNPNSLNGELRLVYYGKSGNERSHLCRVVATTTKKNFNAGLISLVIKPQSRTN